MHRAGAWLGLVAIVALLGCASTAVNVAPRPREGFEILGKTSGDACGLLLLGVIPLGVNSRTERAYQEALKHGGTGLIDTELQTQWWYIPLVGVLPCTLIRGTEVR
jgi:hypothetical protein